MNEPRSAPTDQARPLISVIMANFEAGAKILLAINSVLAQTVTDFELIVSDDASADNSVALVRQAMAADARVKLITTEINGGPGRTRNRALEQARGDWIAIVDADDMIHPERFERLLAAADHFGADVVGDDLLHFHEDGSPAKFLLSDHQERPFAVTAEALIMAGVEPGTVPLGYLKPLIRRQALGSIRYDEAVPIGEDYDLLLRVLLAGGTLYVVPQPWYLYRRHRASISHALSVRDVKAMIDSNDRLVAQLGSATPPLRRAFDRRRAALVQGLDYEALVANLKARNFGPALAALVRQPRLAASLWQSVRDRRRRRAALPAADRAAPRRQLHLGEIAAPGTYVVPPYAPVSAHAWDEPMPRRHWAQLADAAAGNATPPSCEDAAGRYAAGFVQMDIPVHPVAAPLVPHGQGERLAGAK